MERQSLVCGIVGKAEGRMCTGQSRLLVVRRSCFYASGALVPFNNRLKHIKIAVQMIKENLAKRLIIEKGS